LPFSTPIPGGRPKAPPRFQFLCKLTRFAEAKSNGPIRHFRYASFNQLVPLDAGASLFAVPIAMDHDASYGTSTPVLTLFFGEIRPQNAV
jgi:hypothetical protein